MFLPFDSPFSDSQFLQVGDLRIPRFGCLTVNEVLFLDDLRTQQLQVFEAGGLEGDLLLQQILATMVLAGRVSTSWRLAEVQALLNPIEILLLASFLIEEHTCEDSKNQAKALAKGEELPAIDWAELFWKVQRLHPHEPRFNADNFGNCPTKWIEQVLRIAEEQEIERLAAEARAIANLGVAYSQVHGVQNPKTRHFNDFEALLFRKTALKAIEPTTALSFMALHRKGKIPDWIYEVTDLELVRASAATLEE